MKLFIELTPASRTPRRPMLVNVTHILTVDKPTESDQRSFRLGAKVYLDHKTHGWGGVGENEILTTVESYEDIRAALGWEPEP